MPKFSDRSISMLASCDVQLQKVFKEVIKHFDCVVLEGHRGKELQDKYVKEGKSKTPWPTSKHNKVPSMAVDVVPYPVDWKDENRMRFFAGVVIGIAISMGISIRWGGDWDNDRELKDQNFNDLPHFELR